MSAYELAILGGPTSAERNTLTQTIGQMVAAFGLTLGKDILLHDSTSVRLRDRHAAFAAAYFGTRPHRDVAIAKELVHSSAPVIPTINTADEFSRSVPPILQQFNGLTRRVDDIDMVQIAVAMLECVGLLRYQRRAFISYRRAESRLAAMQLHDLLAARGFDVFLDTHDIRPGDSFQDVLWHRLCDSDVMVMLDTRTYFTSKWTRQEFARALAKEIHILRVVWPDCTPNPQTELSEGQFLDRADLISSEGPIIDTVAEQIILAVENLRSRSIASRYMSLTGRLRAEIKKIGATFVGVGAHRAVSIMLTGNRKILAYPVVGVPTAEVLNHVENHARASGEEGVPVLIYDHVGIRGQWADHLQWLDDRIQSVRALKVSEAGWTLAAWEH